MRPPQAFRSCSSRLRTWSALEVNATTEDLIPSAPTSQYQISAEAIDYSGSLVVDDVLRQVPGFSTYRRSSSLFANPTSQGVSLRGVGASATSRSTVLLDGVPLNDPFGGWVYWARVPRAAIESMDGRTAPPRTCIVAARSAV